MTPELSSFFDRAAAAERVGDAEEALAYHSGIPMFQQSRHRGVLEQLIAAGDELTPWAHVRWIVYQALRCEDSGSRTGSLVRVALRAAVETFHGDLLDEAYVEGHDPVKVTATVMGESWASHQLVQDLGVLPTFLDEFVGGDLLEHAELARSWAKARMGGYLIETPGSAGTVTVRDLAGDHTFDVLDLGAAGTVIGRLVPSGTTPALMFDTAPLAVSEEIATEVARCDRPVGWVDVLVHAIGRRRLDPECLLREDYELLSDIPSLDLLAFGTHPAELPRVMAQLRDGRDEVGRAAFRILRFAAEGALEPADAPYVAAASLNVHAHGEAVRRILAPGQQQVWLGWAELVPDPARARLLHFARSTAEAA
jgi:hypothetical protein